MGVREARGASGPAPPALSVVICTRNRPASLARALDSLCRCAAGATRQGYEVVVVNNGDPRETQDLEARYQGRLPLRVVAEPIAGLSHARNAGVRAARGEWILWTDDDVSVTPQWLAEYMGALACGPDACVLGGPIEPVFDSEPPAWIASGLPHIRSAFASRERDDLGETFGVDGPLPYGANFAMRRSDLLARPFDASLGRHPQSPTRGSEESVVIADVLRRGGRGRWLRRAAVRHHIDAPRLTTAYIGAYYRDAGHAYVMLDARRQGPAQAAARWLLASAKAAWHAAQYAAARALALRSLQARALRDTHASRGAAAAWLHRLRADAPDRGARN